MFKKILKYLRGIGEYKLSVFSLVLLTVFVRFYNFPNRWGIGADNARDAIIALEAIGRHHLPLMGPFSSAGPFVTGGIYYWIIMLSYLVLPFVISAPWILTGIVSVISVLLLIYFGKILVGKRFSLVLGLLAAFSPQYVGKAIELGNPAFVAVFSILSIIFFVKLWQTKRLLFSFLIGLAIGLGINMHYEAINLLIFLPMILFIPKIPLKNKVLFFILSAFGVFLTLLPLLYWDFGQGFANSRNILDYLLIGQYRIYVPNSWRLFLFNYFPTYWSTVITNFPLIGLFLFFASGIIFIAQAVRKKVSAPMLFLSIIFLIMFILNKSYRGERTDDYMLYFSPFILMFTAFLVETLFGFKNFLIRLSGIAVLTVIIALNLVYVKNVLTYQNKFPVEKMIIASLEKRFPDSKFSIYDYKHQNYGYSMPISLILLFANRVDANGEKIGVDCYGRDCPGRLLTIVKKPVQIISLKATPVSKLDPKKGLWINVNPDSVYDNQVGWLNKHQLKSTFSLKDYIISKL